MPYLPRSRLFRTPLHPSQKTRKYRKKLIVNRKWRWKMRKSLLLKRKKEFKLPERLLRGKMVIHVSSCKSANEPVHNYIDVDNDRQSVETPQIEPLVNPIDHTAHTHLEKVFADESNIAGASRLMSNTRLSPGHSEGALLSEPQTLLGGHHEMMVHMAPLVAREENNALATSIALERAWFNLG
ncbi:hypothetical protein Tco_1106088, partial [Tanacetum coccineum]